jgi:hypothetical protein
MIYGSDSEGFTISSRCQWRPGWYATRQAARWAYQFDDEVLARLRDRINRREQRPIRSEDLRVAKCTTCAGT